MNRKISGSGVAFALAIFVLSGCGQVKPQLAPWQIETQADRIRDNFLVFGTIWSNEYQGEDAATFLRINLNADGTSVIFGTKMAFCTVNNPIVFRFDNKEPSYLPCVGDHTTASSEFVDDLMRSQSLVIEHTPLLGQASQYTFNISGFGAAFEAAKRDGTPSVGNPSSL